MYISRKDLMKQVNLLEKKLFEISKQNEALGRKSRLLDIYMEEENERLEKVQEDYEKLQEKYEILEERYKILKERNKMENEKNKMLEDKLKNRL